MKFSMLTCGLLLAGIICWAAAASSAPPDDARPSMDLKAAIELAEQYAKKEQIDLTKHFLYSVNLVTKPGMGGDFEWRVVWDQAQRANDDEIELAVQMDKKVARLFRG